MGENNEMTLKELEDFFLDYLGSDKTEHHITALRFLRKSGTQRMLPALHTMYLVAIEEQGQPYEETKKFLYEMIAEVIAELCLRHKCNIPPRTDIEQQFIEQLLDKSTVWVSLDYLKMAGTSAALGPLHQLLSTQYNYNILNGRGFLHSYIVDVMSAICEREYNK